MEKMDMMSMDRVQENIAKIRALFPECVTEVKRDGKVTLAVDFDELKQEMSGMLIDEREERYQMTWPDKRKAKLLANTSISATLRPCKEESVDFDNTQNLYIEGDNLDVLKLLQETYLGKVKMIYIDPPYNTGSDFVYEDDFAQSAEEYVANSGQYDDQGNRLVENKETNGRFHTDWLNMIYPRLMVARDLLTDDGVIFISCDDHEQANLKKVCDEVFGASNFIATICHKARASVSNDKIISSNHNFLLLYAKDVLVVHLKRSAIGLNPDLDGFDKTDENGRYKLVPVDGPGGARKGNPYYEFLGVEGYWRFSKETMQEKYNRGLIVKTDNALQQKYYLAQAINSRKTDTTWWDKDVLTSNATSELAKLLGGKFFDNPKAVNLLLRQLCLFTNDNKKALILDFFSGSATTAHAVMQLNAEDGGHRKFIMVQLPEKCDEKSEAYKAGYKNICEIGKERIRRAGKKIKEDSPLTTQDLDVGFRVLKLDSSNMKDVYYKAEDYAQTMITGLEDNVKEDRTPLDLLFQVMLDLGQELSAKIEEKTIAGKTVWCVEGNNIIACFDSDINDQVVTEIAKLKPLYAVFRDSSFVSDAAAANCEQIFASISPTTSRKVI